MIQITKVYKINKRLVVADTIEEAIKIYREKETVYKEIENVTLMIIDDIVKTRSCYEAYVDK